MVVYNTFNKKHVYKRYFDRFSISQFELHINPIF